MAGDVWTPPILGYFARGAIYRSQLRGGCASSKPGYVGFSVWDGYFDGGAAFIHSLGMIKICVCYRVSISGSSGLIVTVISMFYFNLWSTYLLTLSLSSIFPAARYSASSFFQHSFISSFVLSLPYIMCKSRLYASSVFFCSTSKSM